MSDSALVTISDTLQNLHEAFNTEHGLMLRNVLAEATSLNSVWSGSNFGYHANVYFKDFSLPPPEAHFSVEWGSRDEPFGAFGGGTSGDWQEYHESKVFRRIYAVAGNLEQSPAESASGPVAAEVNRLREEIISNLSIAIQNHDDTYLQRLKEQAEAIVIRSEFDFGRSLVPPGPNSTRDSAAAHQGYRLAPHQKVMAKAAALANPAACAMELANIARQAGSHIARRKHQTDRDRLIGTNVFIGHGRSSAWRILKDFINERLCLPYDEFNRVPVAGITNIARLSEMLFAAAVAFVILTAEDEQADGTLHARMNVIHEVGLFQGRLGFTKAIVLLEEGCEEFTNIQGLGQIRFPKNNIGAAFEEVRQVLEREGMLKV